MNEQKTFIIGSISQEEQIKKLADKFNTTMYVKHQPNKSFKQLVSEAFTNIEEADLIIAVKKPDGTFGEGTTYELEYARRLGKRIQTEDVIPLKHKRKETINIEFDKLPDYVRDYYTKENRTRSDYKEIIGQLEHDIMLINLRLTCPKLYFPNEDSIPEVIKNKDVLELILNRIQNEFDVDLIDESEENDGYVWGTNNAKKSSNNNEITW